MSDIKRTLGVIGGSGLYELDGLTEIEETKVSTAFGEPSDLIISGVLGETRLLFLPRHGRGHRLAPHRINYRANILAMKALGAEQLLSISAVGSMREEVVPGDMLIVDQFIDRTRHRVDTFFDEDVVAHVSFADPVDPALGDALEASGAATGSRCHRGGTYLCMEGPQFSTRAESNLYRSWGVDVIGMTNLPEARLAREAELPYATLAMATDYDCWREGHADVTVEVILEVMHQNVKSAKGILRELTTRLPDPLLSPSSSALKGAIVTATDAIPPSARERLAPLIGHYLP